MTDGGELDAREAEFQRFKAETRLEIVEELIRAHGLGWGLIAAVESAADRAEAGAVLMGSPFAFTAMAAEHVLDIPLGQRTEQGQAFLAAERDELMGFLGR